MGRQFAEPGIVRDHQGGFQIVVEPAQPLDQGLGGNQIKPPLDLDPNLAQGRQDQTERLLGAKRPRAKHHVRRYLVVGEPVGDVVAGAAAAGRERAVEIATGRVAARLEVAKQIDAFHERTVPKAGRARQTNAAAGRLNEAERKADEAARLALERGEVDAAIAAWRALAEAHPENGELRYRLAFALRAKGEDQAALEAYRQAVEAAPRHADAWNNLGNLLADLDRPEEAIKALAAALRLRPRDARTLCNLGAARLKAEDAAGAIRDFRSAIAAQPDHAPAHGNLGAALCRQGEAAEGIDAFRRALALDSKDAKSWSNLANALQDERRYDEALEASARAAALAPTNPGTLAARARVLTEVDRLDQAEALLRLALGLAPKHAEALNQFGILCSQRERNAEAARYFQAAAAARRNFVDAELNRAIALLAAGDFAKGFAAYEARWKLPKSPPRGFGLPAWTGEALGGRSILLHTEQGLGDAIQFARFVPEVAARGGRVVVECQPELLRLFAGLKGVAQTVPRFSHIPPVQCEAPLLSLPRLLATRLDRLSNRPYLAPHPEILRRFAASISEQAQGLLKVGLVWAGNPKHGNDRRRSISPASLERFAMLKGVRFFSLQKAAREALPAELRAVDLAPLLDDLADAAAALGALDVLVSVDTALAHLAGALGRPALVLLPAAADWRWLERRSTSPWYPSLELFRQDLDKPGEWDGPLSGVADRLRALAKGR